MLICFKSFHLMIVFINLTFLQVVFALVEKYCRCKNSLDLYNLHLGKIFWGALPVKCRRKMTAASINVPFD
jgi:hypothetical protein